jgi:NAD(P)-dependent dehydrogenase (short-subunit alcohol dehydrogenase family)
MTSWTTKNIPNQAGRRILITGATGGLGFETALALAGAGGDVILTGRNAEKGELALRKIRAQYASATIRYEHLDLASLASVAAFADRYATAHESLDVLINNAGVMMPPYRQETEDGFELQFGTNFLGHYALTAHLLPLLRAAKKPRVVNLSSMAHRNGAIHFDDLQSQLEYRRWRTYAMSKLAMLMFAFELQRRSDAGRWNLVSNAAHPGYARTNLIENGLGHEDWLTQLSKPFEPYLSQSAAEGALPTLFAATSPMAARAGYYGPDGFFELKGRVKEAFVAPQAESEAVAARLWSVSEQITGARWPAAHGARMAA